MPIGTPARPIPMMRSNTFSVGYETETGANRGRNRSRQFSQVPEEEYEEDYDHRPTDKDRKHRSSKKHRSPEHGVETRYHVDNGRTKLYHSSSSRKPTGYDTFPYEYDAQPATSTTPGRDSTFSSGPYKVRQSKSYNSSDVQYSSYPTAQAYREGYPAVYA